MTQLQTGKKKEMQRPDFSGKKLETEPGKKLIDESQWPEAYIIFVAFAPKIFADKETYGSFFSMFKACLNS
jgi:hypothetical protein